MLERRINGLAVENRSLADRLSKLHQEVKALNQAVLEAGKTEISSVRSTQARLANRLEELQAELLRLNGLIEQMDHQRQIEEEETQRFRKEAKDGMEKLQEELKLLLASAKVTQEVERARKEAAEGAIDLYQQALELIKNEKYTEAKQALRMYIEQNPKGSRVANAHFWMGESEYKLQRYEESILEYQKVISRFPKSNKVADALLKQGLAFAKLGDSESAKIVLKKLVKEYPKSPQAQTANKQLTRLK